MEGLDYAWASPSITQLHGWGVSFVCRYLSWLPNTKVISPAEAQTLRAAGIDVVLNWEYDGDGEIRAGYASGASAAAEAARQAQAIGYPAGATIYFSVDFDAAGPECADFFRGAATKIGPYRVGAYGCTPVLGYLFDHGLIDKGWNTYAWSGGVWEPRAHIQQYSNGDPSADYDRDRAVQTDFGSWNCVPARTATPAPAPIPSPTASGDDDMLTTIIVSPGSPGAPIPIPTPNNGRVGDVWVSISTDFGGRNVRAAIGSNRVGMRPLVNLHQNVADPFTFWLPSCVKAAYQARKGDEVLSVTLPATGGAQPIGVTIEAYPA